MTQSTKHSLLAALAVALLSCTTTASASVDTSPKPGGKYPLKPGIYVAAGSDCADPANAAIRRYDGKGISTAHTRACTVSVKQRKRSRFTVDQTCIDSGAGPGRRFKERQVITISDALTFRQKIGSGETTYRYCAPYQLPAGLRKY